MKPALFLAAIGVYFVSALLPGEGLDRLASVLSLLIVLAVFRAATGFVRTIGSAFLAVGLALLLANRASVPDAIFSFGYMMNVLGLFALLPLVAIPIELGRYAIRVQAMIRRRVRHSGTLYAITSSLSYMFCAFMNLAALPMVHQTIRPSLDAYPIEERDRFISRAITHGYSLPVLWSPIAPIMGIVVEMTGVRWGAILPIVIPLSMLGLALDCGMGMWIAKRRARSRKEREAGTPRGTGAAELAAAAEPPEDGDDLANGREAGKAAGESPSNREAAAGSASRAAWALPDPSFGAKGGEMPRNPLQIVFAIVAFNALVALLERMTQAGFLLLVSLSVVPFAFVWSALLGKGRLFLKAAGEKLPGHLLRMQDSFFVYLSAGFMIAALQSTGAGHGLNRGLTLLKEAIGSEPFLLLIPLIPFLLAFAGLHPAVGLALAAESLDPAVLGLSPELTAIAMLTGASAAFLMGPYNATAGMMAGLVNRSPYRVSNWNAPYTAAYLGLSMTVLIFLHEVGGRL
ncbi:MULTISPECIES: hypothetical protein [Cohnella]|uniref:hypothetical protein n=1 Tax=Cohnella TaxID=329857 RepID=UPI0009BBEB25|nr:MULTISPECIES: hypothetical protein [Cohnella]MBN2982482.1 hypothetical protein [Cohnella algarum]